MYGFRQSLPHNVRCDLCKRQTKLPYLVEIEGNSYHFCSGAHAMTAMNNFKKKQEEGFPATPPDVKPEENNDITE